MVCILSLMNVVIVAVSKCFKVLLTYSTCYLMVSARVSHGSH